MSYFYWMNQMFYNIRLHQHLSWYFQTTWRCSICRRKLQSRAQPVLAQDSTDSLLDVPVLEALQRRHSDVKIGSSSLAVSSGPSGLAPPRSPELRRHSDVSPVSLKELEKVMISH